MEDCALLIRRRYQEGNDGECAMLQQKTNEANKKHLNEVATGIIMSVSSLSSQYGRHLRDVERHFINLSVVEFCTLTSVPAREHTSMHAYVQYRAACARPPW